MITFTWRVLAMAVLASCWVSCTTVQETGRSQLMLISPSDEMQMGLSSFDQIKQETPVSREATVNARIQRIGQRIAAAVGRELPSAQWEFVVFDESQTINAFALPGGKVGVYTGLINLAASDDEIAIVMGHEVAHVTSRHGGERYSQQLAVQGLGAVLGVAANDNRYRDYYLMAYSGVSTLGLLKYSRDHESEADAVGLRFAANAGYDPRAAVTFWKKMAQQGGGQEPPKWLSTHPPTQERIANLERLAASLMPVYEQARARYR